MLLLGGEGVEHLETVGVAKDGSRIDVSVTVSPGKGPRRPGHWGLEDRSRHHSAPAG